MVAITMWIAIAAISISAIWAGVYSDKKKNEGALEKGNGTSEDIKALIAQNKSLQERVQNLESIITNLDEDLLLLNTVETNSQEKVKRLAAKINDKKEDV